MSEYLLFREEEPNKKTRVVRVMAKQSGLLLGIIKWYGAWRHYCYFPRGDTVYSDRCLLEISEIVTSMNQDYSLERKKDKELLVEAQQLKKDSVRNRKAVKEAFNIK
jgi:hypothetical protein